MTALVERPDLTRPRGLSKSELGQFDLCQTRAWHAIHDPRPFITNEKVVFGSAVDAGVEVIVKSLASGQTPNLVRAGDAMGEVLERDGIEVDRIELMRAVASFVDDVAPKFDWSYTVTQASITTVIDGLGEANGHPDLILGDGRIYDVKTSSRAKEVPSPELGFYALLVEATGATVPAVGYMNWVRLKRPYWQVIEAPVDDELRRRTYEQAAGYVRAKKADAVLNAKSATPGNYSMVGGPKFDGLCGDCPYNPANGGPCLIVRRESHDDAA